MSLTTVSAAVGAANQPITISSSPSLPSPRVFLQKSNAPHSPSGGAKENERQYGEVFSPDVSERQRVPFNELVGNFGCPRNGASPKRSDVGEAPTKRRRIELQDQKALAPIQRRAKKDMLPPSKPVKRPKSPKKKVQTITALATAAYQRPRDAAEEATVPDRSVLDHSLEQGRTATATSKPAAEGGDKPKKPRKPRAKAAEKQTKPVAPKKVAKSMKAKAKDAIPRQELYSPQKATARLLRQDFLFGTSSQLAAPDSPTLIRQVQTAMGESEAALVSPQALRAAQHKSYFKVPSAPQGTNLSVGQADKELWCSAARDLKGGVARSAYTVSRLSRPAVKASAPIRGTTATDSPGYAAPIAANKPEELADNSMETADRGPKSKDANGEVHVSSFLDIDTYTSSRPPSNTYRVVDALTASTPKIGRAVSQPESASLAGNKTLSDMVDLNSIPPSTQAVKPKKAKHPIARKKKAAPATPPRQPTFRSLEDISDDEKVASPSPPRVRGRMSPSAIRPLPLSPAGSRIPSPAKASSDGTALTATASIKATDSQWPGLAKLLFPRITETVKAAPHSTRTEDMTWHEKILLYDPIILEDFTAWLNEQGLRIMVTRLTRKTTTKTRSRKTKDTPDDAADKTVTEPTTGATETVPESLQHWMVQKWCEEHSICCCSKDTFRGGARAKY